MGDNATCVMLEIRKLHVCRRCVQVLTEAVCEKHIQASLGKGSHETCPSTPGKGQTRGVSNPAEAPGTQPCGWCGSLCVGGSCSISLAKGSKVGVVKVTSTCPYAYTGIRYVSALKSTQSAPCTNVPVECQACMSANVAVTIWSYYYLDHLLLAHGSEHVSPAEVAKYAVEPAEFHAVVKKAKLGSQLAPGRIAKLKRGANVLGEAASKFWAKLVGGDGSAGDAGEGANATEPGAEPDNEPAAGPAAAPPDSGADEPHCQAGGRRGRGSRGRGRGRRGSRGRGRARVHGV